MTTPDKVVKPTHYYEILGTDIVDFYIGPERKHFMVHKDPLCTEAPYFAAMLNRSFKEGLEKNAELPDGCPEMFSLFVEWLYMDRLRPIDISLNTTTNGPIFDRVKLYCFAEKICLAGLKDYAMSMLLATYATFVYFPSIEAVQYVYETTSPGAHLRFFMANSVVFFISHGNKKNWRLKTISKAMAASSDLSVDVLELMRSTSRESHKHPLHWKYCDLHIHEKDCRFREMKSLGDI